MDTNGKTGKKGYEYIPKLLAMILNARRTGTGNIARPNMLAHDDPRQLATTIAKLPPKATKILVEEKMSRFKK